MMQRQSLTTFYGQTGAQPVPEQMANHRKSPLHFTAMHDIIMEHNLLGQFRSSAQLSPLPSSCTLQSIHYEGSKGGTEKALVVCRYRSAVANILVCYQHCFDHRSKTQYHISCYKENSIPARLCICRYLSMYVHIQNYIHVNMFRFGDK